MNRTTVFRKLHSEVLPLILPNVWDVAGARIIETLGAKAVATTSAAVAWSQGYPDGNRLPAHLLSRLTEQIVEAVNVPVSIDFEAGYSDDPQMVAENLKPLLASGIAGINLEDGAASPATLAAKIEAIKKLAESLHLDVFVNARTDVYLQDLVTDDKKLQETLARAVMYRSAGADGLFVPGLTDVSEIARITGEIELPINLMASAELSDLAGLAKLKVRRLSAGTALAQIVYRHFACLAEKFLEVGDCGIFNEDALAYSHLQNLFQGRK